MPRSVVDLITIMINESLLQLFLLRAIKSKK